MLLARATLRCHRQKKREKIAGWQKATVCYGERDEARGVKAWQLGRELTAFLPMLLPCNAMMPLTFALIFASTIQYCDRIHARGR